MDILFSLIKYSNCKLVPVYIFLYALMPSNVISQVLINEFQASNISTKFAPDDNYEDWIELYNAGSSSVDLEGYYLTDDPDYLQKFQISGSLKISSKSHLLIWADKNDFKSYSTVHTNFSLNNYGEFLALVSPGGSIVDSLTFPFQLQDVSYGRLGSSASEWAYFEIPTPNSSNTTKGITELCYIDTVEFSVNGGFYSGEQQITLSASPESAEIRYTLDGSIPDRESDKYNSPINISSSAVIRARAYLDSCLPGNITTNTYMINENFSLPVVSISTDRNNFYDSKYGIYVVGTNGTTGGCYSGPANWNRNWERPVNFEYYTPEGEQVINQQAGIKIQGYCSRSKAIKPISLTARNKFRDDKLKYRFFKDKSIDEFKSILLRNSGNDVGYSYLRDAYMQTLVKTRMDLDFQGYQPVIVFFNGDYWGLMNQREKVNEHYVAANYDINSDSIDMLYKDNVVVNGSKDDYVELMNFVNTHNMEDSASYAYVEERVDINEMLNYFIANIYFSNHDWPNSNIKTWKPSNREGRWRYVMYDTDMGFALFGKTGNTVEHAMNIHELFRPLMDNEGYKEEFTQRFCSHLNTTFLPERELHILDSLKNLIADDLPRQISKWGLPFSYSRWEDNVNNIMVEFANTRSDSIRIFLRNKLGLENDIILQLLNENSDLGTIIVNEVSVPDTFSGKYFGELPIRLKAIPNEGSKFSHWEGDVTSTSAEIKLSSDSDISIRAHFIEENSLENIFINEFMANSSLGYIDDFGEEEDWIEIYNGNNFPVNISGLFLSDSIGELPKYAIPSDLTGQTTIAPMDFLILYADDDNKQGARHLNFKLNSSKEDIFLSQRIGNSIQILDSVSYSTQLNSTSFGRYPDGVGSWQYMITSPKSSNVLQSTDGLLINEIMTDNEGVVESPLNDSADWIELYNSGDIPIDVGGLFLTDSLADPMKYRIPVTDPDSTTIMPGGYIIFWADKNPSAGIFHLNFKLSSSGEQVALFSYDARTIIDSLSFGKVYSNRSFGRSPDGDILWQQMVSSPGRENTAPNFNGLVINEFMANNQGIVLSPDGERSDWIELYNTSDSAINIGGLFICDSLGDPGKHRIPLSYPDSTTIQPGQYMVLWANNNPEQSVLNLNFKLGKSGEQIILYGYDGKTIIDSLSYVSSAANISYGRFIDGGNNWKSLWPSLNNPNRSFNFNGLIINELMSDNEGIIISPTGENSDWIEIYNGSDTILNIGGLFITDSLGNPKKHRIPLTFPDSTQLPPGEHIILWADNNPDKGILHLDFGLKSSGEQIGLFDYDAAELIDSITYPELYKDASYCRIIDGSDTWIHSPHTFSSANNLKLVDGLIINEISADNKNILADKHNDYDDWIELYNSTKNPIDIGGLYIVDSLSGKKMHRISNSYPGSTTINPGDYLILWADDQTSQGILHLNFKLSGNGEQLGLFAFDGNKLIDSVTYPEQYKNSSYSRVGDSDWAYLPSTPNDENKMPDIQSLYINEFMTSYNTVIADNHGEFEDWIEIYNSGDQAIDLGGLFFSDTIDCENSYRIPSLFPDSTMIYPGQYFVFWADGETEQGIHHLDFKLSRNNEEIALYSYDMETIVDSVSYTNTEPKYSYGRIVDGNNVWSKLLPPSPLAPNHIIKLDLDEPLVNQVILLYPNPFNDILNISLNNEKGQYCEVSVYDLRGKKISSLINNYMDSGEINLSWNPTTNAEQYVSGGIYILKVALGDEIQSFRIVYMR